MKNYFVHPSALCESTAIGEKTRIWAFAHVLPGAAIGRDCNVCDHVFIENAVVVGDRVTIKCGVQLWDGVRLEDDVFVGPNATFTNDLFPRSKHYQAPSARTATLVRRGASIGANATILAGITIGAHAMIGAGAVVTSDVPAHAKVVGNPARIVGYVDDAGASGSAGPSPVDLPGPGATAVKGVTLHELPLVHDMRGDLVVGEFGRTLPFSPKRYFMVFEVPSDKVRGEHAHRKCHQFLVCIRGSCSVVADDGSRRQEIVLDRPGKGLHLPPMTWSVQYKYSADAMLLVFASEHYDPEDYIRSYDEFAGLVKLGQ